MDLDGLRTEITTETGRTDVTSARLTSMLNQILVRFSLMHSWRELEVRMKHTTEADEAEYLWPTSPACEMIRNIVLVDDASSWPLERIYFSRMDELYPNPATLASDRPRGYVLWRGTYELVPVPDAAYALYIRYTRKVNTLSEDEDTPLITTIDDALIAEACARVYRSTEEYEKMRIFHAQALEMVAQGIGHDRRKPDWLPKVNSAVRGPMSIGDAANPFVGL